MIEINNVSYEYSSPSHSTHALKNITVSIPSGKITAVMGHTGSGKSTLMEIISGLAEPASGYVKINGCKASAEKTGLVFQYPEYQLFAETVYDDIAFGIRNLEHDEIKKRVERAAQRVHLPSELMNRSPFSLSGGQKRLAALAGILAMEREILILDEPSAGLDPSGRNMLFSMLRELIAENKNMTIIFVTHSMDDAAEYADNIIVLDSGKLIMHGKPDDVFAKKDILLSCGLDIPEMAKLSETLLQHGIDIGRPLTVSQAYKNIMQITDNTKENL